MNSDASNNQTLKYQRFTPSGFRDKVLENWDLGQRLTRIEQTTLF